MDKFQDPQYVMVKRISLAPFIVGIQKSKETMRFKEKRVNKREVICIFLKTIIPENISGYVEKAKNLLWFYVYLLILQRSWNERFPCN